MDNSKGYVLEQDVELILRNLESTFPDRVKVSAQRSFRNVPRPHRADFELEYRLGGLTHQHLIECQNRERSSQEIADKIYAVRGMSDRNRYILVYKDWNYLSRSVKKRLNEMGVLYFDLEHFEFEFLSQLGADLALHELGQMAINAPVQNAKELTGERFQVLLDRASSYSPGGSRSVDRAMISGR